MYVEYIMYIPKNKYIFYFSFSIHSMILNYV